MLIDKWKVIAERLQIDLKLKRRGETVTSLVKQLEDQIRRVEQLITENSEHQIQLTTLHYYLNYKDTPVL